jgi:hypothetical protein
VHKGLYYGRAKGNNDTTENDMTNLTTMSDKDLKAAHTAARINLIKFGDKRNAWKRLDMEIGRRDDIKFRAILAVEFPGVFG